MKFDTVNSRWPIVYIEECQVRISKTITSLSQKIDFVAAHSAGPDPSGSALFAIVRLKGFLVLNE